MKKVILALAIVSVSFVACNDDKKTEEKTTSDTTTVIKGADTATVVKDTTIKTSVDTINKK